MGDVCSRSGCTTPIRESVPSPTWLVPPSQSPKKSGRSKALKPRPQKRRWHSTQSTWSETETFHDLLPWDGQEELVSVHKHGGMQSGGWSSMRMFGFLAFGISALVPFVRGAKDLKSSFLAVGGADNKLERHMV